MYCILIGIISGIINGFGMGGGTVLILLLSLLLNVNQHIAQGTNLIFFIPTSLASTIINIKNRSIDRKLAIVIIMSGVIGVIIGTIVSVKINVEILKKLFGFFLTIITIHEIIVWINEYKREKKRYIKKKGGSC